MILTFRRKDSVQSVDTYIADSSTCKACFDSARPIIYDYRLIREFANVFSFNSDGQYAYVSLAYLAIRLSVAAA